MTRLACAHALSAGINLPPLLRRVGLKLRDIEDESIPITVMTQIKCLNLIAVALDDNLLGFHVAQNMDLRGTGFLYYVAASAKTLGDGLLNIARYAGSVNEGVDPKVEIGKTLRIGLAYSGVSRQSDRHQTEAWIVALVRFCREMTGRGLQPLRVRLMHDRIPESEEFDSFLGRAAQFTADRDEMLFAREAVNLPIVSADPYLNKLLIKHCDHVIASRKAPTGAFRAQVENAIAALLPHGQARVDIVAKKLGIGPRTLRRRLSGEATSFAGILQDLRIELAKRYIAEPNLSISLIAWLLGYTEVSAFSHAFRRWTGRAPRVDRSRRRSRASSGVRGTRDRH
jgi:AraC-like DNA-binding protein